MKHYKKTYDLNTKVIRVNLADYARLSDISSRSNTTIAEALHQTINIKTIQDIKKANKDWGYLGIPSAIKCAHSYKLDPSGHGFCIHCNREVHFDSSGTGPMQVIKEGTGR